MARLEEEPKVGKGKDQGRLRKNKHGEKREKKKMKGQQSINRLLVSILVWPSHGPDHHSLSRLPTELYCYTNYFSKSEDTILCIYAHVCVCL